MQITSDKHHVWPSTWALPLSARYNLNGKKKRVKCPVSFPYFKYIRSAVVRTLPRREPRRAPRMLLGHYRNERFGEPKRGRAGGRAGGRAHSLQGEGSSITGTQPVHPRRGRGGKARAATRACACLLGTWHLTPGRITAGLNCWDYAGENRNRGLRNLRVIIMRLYSASRAQLTKRKVKGGFRRK